MSTSTHRWPLLLLVLAMLWSQALGLWHGTLHAQAMEAHGHASASVQEGSHVALHAHGNGHGHGNPHEHGNEHAFSHPKAPASAEASPEASAAGLPQGPGWVGDHAAGDRDCRLLDQLLHADVLSPPSGPVLGDAGTERPVLPVAAPPHRTLGWLPLARGPPRA